MKIAVIGAGIIGITTAYELACDGHSVSVFEKTSAAAEGASFGCTGVISSALMLPNSLPPWPLAPSFGPLRKLGLVQMDSKFSMRDHKWLWRWKHASSIDAYVQRRRDAQNLVAYSQQRLNQIANESKLEFERSTGQLVLVKTDTDLKGLDLLTQSLREESISFKLLNQSESMKVEPALSGQASFHSAIYFPDDEVANCRQFALLLKSESARLNVKFQFNTAVIGLEAALKPKLTTSIGTDTLTHDFDQVVLCVGAVPRKVMHALKASPPPARVTGYSLSANIREPLNAPRSAVMDLNSKIVISRMGNRVRVSGAGYLSGNLRKNVESETEVLYQALQNYFPGAIHMNHGTQTWVGSRSQYSDGLPCIGPSAVPGVWLNMGHGSNGWGMALGAARSIADLIDGRATEVNCEKFHPARWLA